MGGTASVIPLALKSEIRSPNSEGNPKPELRSASEKSRPLFAAQKEADRVLELLAVRIGIISCNVPIDKVTSAGQSGGMMLKLSTTARGRL